MFTGAAIRLVIISNINIIVAATGIALPALKKQEWIEARLLELLPVKYYHVVFTLPHELNGLVLGHRKLLFKLLFDASARTLLSFAKDPKYPGAMPGIISVLHTWGQQLSFHPHIHSIISGGGIIKVIPHFIH
jgi:hypothetical protein